MIKEIKVDAGAFGLCVPTGDGGNAEWGETVGTTSRNERVFGGIIMNHNTLFIRRQYLIVALAFVFAATAFLAASCSKPPGVDPADDNVPRVFVSIPPQAYFVEKVGGEFIDVSVMVGPGQNPHGYEPTPKKMVQLSGAKLYFSIGMSFENAFLSKLSSGNKDLKIVDSRVGIKLRKIGGEHGHDDHATEDDPHVWLDPANAIIQAKTICAELSILAPEHKDYFEKNKAAFIEELDALDKKISETLAPFKGQDFYVFHPAFGYFGDAYGLRQVAVETGGKEPSAKQLAALIDKTRADGIKIIFVQAQFSEKSARTLADAIGGAVVPMDPLARDYVRNLEVMADKISAAFKSRKE